MLDYISVREAAGEWESSEPRIQKLCEKNDIIGAVRFGHARAITIDAENLLMQEEKGIIWKMGLRRSYDEQNFGC